MNAELVEFPVGLPSRRVVLEVDLDVGRVPYRDAPALRDVGGVEKGATEVLRPASDACSWVVLPGEAVEDVLDAEPATNPLKVEDILNLQSMTV